MDITIDYRDTLRSLIDELRTEQGITIYQISKRAVMGEQILTAVLRKERNLSARSLTRLVGSLGYRMRFEKIISPASSPSVPNKS